MPLSDGCLHLDVYHGTVRVLACATENVLLYAMELVAVNLDFFHNLWIQSLHFSFRELRPMFSGTCHILLQY